MSIRGKRARNLLTSKHASFTLLQNREAGPNDHPGKNFFSLQLLLSWTERFCLIDGMGKMSLCTQQCLIPERFYCILKEQPWCDLIKLIEKLKAMSSCFWGSSGTISEGMPPSLFGSSGCHPGLGDLVQSHMSWGNSSRFWCAFFFYKVLKTWLSLQVIAQHFMWAHSLIFWNRIVIASDMFFYFFLFLLCFCF